MSREEKFRVWDKSDKVMCEVTYLKFSEAQCLDVGYRNSIHGKSADENALLDENMSGTCVLMRCTGKRDTSGRKVFEGDIVENPDGVRMEIHYGLYQAWCPADQCYMDNIGFYAEGPGLPQMPIGPLEDYAEVIGTIYEPPELMEEETEIVGSGLADNKD